VGRRFEHLAARKNRRLTIWRKGAIPNKQEDTGKTRPSKAGSKIACGGVGLDAQWEAKRASD
jgi:hypothetical protein